MFVRFWGTRGSIPTPGSNTAIYGGNTSCVEIRTDDGTLIILDCGTGIRELGLQLLKSGSFPERMYLLIGHTHWDHIHGFPFFTPAFLPKTELNIYAPAGFRNSLEDSLAGQMQYSYFPVKLQDLPSRIHYTELEEGFFRIGDILVETQYLNHTAPTIAYRITSGGATLAYVTDHEPFWNSPGPVFHHPGDQRHVEFLKGADLVIHDAQYTTEEYSTKRGWGHSPIDYVTDVAGAAEVARLALFHHDPTHDDTTLGRLEEHARSRAASRGSFVDIFAASEGMEFELKGKARPAAVRKESALERRPIEGGRILVVTDSLNDISAVEQVLAEDGLIVSSAADGRTALLHPPQPSPDLVILNSKLDDGDGASFIQPIRSMLGKPELPIIILTQDQESSDAVYSAESIATDYLAKPFSPPMLRTRVRAWLARTMLSVLKDEATLQQSRTAQSTIGGAGTNKTVVADGLAGTPLLRLLTAEQLGKLMTRSMRRSYPAGHVIVRQGETGHNVYVTLSGRVRITETLSDSPIEMFFGELGPGEVFGELGILRERARSATIVTLERTNCLVIPEQGFLDALRTSPEMSLSLLRVLAGRLYEADRLLARHAPDPLTALPGRRAFHELYRRLAAGARRRNSSVLLLALDVLHLKAINDQFGYSVGNDVLRAVADALLDSSRTTDLVARYGGDEFAVLLVEADDKTAAKVVERVRQKVQALAAHRALPLEVDCSIGYAVSLTPPDTVDELLRAADQNMQMKRLSTPR